MANANWDATIRHVEASQPDLVVHTGDISLDGANDADDLRHARSQLDRIPVPWMAVPGNHDLGEPFDTSDEIIERRRKAYESVFGERFWSSTLGEWKLVGLDSQQLLDDGDDTGPWWDWTDSELSSAQPTVVFQHRPLTPIVDGEHDNPIRYVTEPVRSRLRALLGRNNVRLVVSGHVHQWRSIVIDETSHVWAPSTWATMGDAMQPLIGTKAVGIVEIALDEHASAGLHEPEGITQAILGETIPSPYHH